MDRKGFIRSLSFFMAAPIISKAETVLSELAKAENTERMPVIFIGHGNPMHALHDNAFTQALNGIQKTIIGSHSFGTKPKAMSI